MQSLTAVGRAGGWAGGGWSDAGGRWMEWRGGGMLRMSGDATILIRRSSRRQPPWVWSGSQCDLLDLDLSGGGRAGESLLLPLIPTVDQFSAPMLKCSRYGHMYGKEPSK